MAASPAFAATPISAAGSLSVANAGRDGTGTVVTIYTAPAAGARIDDISIKAKVTTTAGMVRLFIHDGSVYHLWREVLVTAITASASVAAFESHLTSLGLVLASGWSLRACTNNAEAISVSVTRGATF